MNEYQEHLERLIAEVRTAYRVRRSMHKIKPQVLIGNDRTVTEMIIHYTGGEPDWKQEVYLQVIEDEEETVVRVIRSIDMSSGEVVVL